MIIYGQGNKGGLIARCWDKMKRGAKVVGRGRNSTISD